jgi:hypothetical protein
LAIQTVHARQRVEAMPMQRNTTWREPARVYIIYFADMAGLPQYCMMQTMTAGTRMMTIRSSVHISKAPSWAYIGLRAVPAALMKKERPFVLSRRDAIWGRHNVHVRKPKAPEFPPH